MRSTVVVLVVLSVFVLLCSAVPVPEQPYYDLDPNTADLTEPEGELMGPVYGFFRRTRSAYADYIQHAAASFRNVVYKPFQMMGINRHNLR
ncbi:hypothetical protein Ocin01_09346 [Orchesella cincta]|uniref:Uncharacterized protein n=1 Tax=Orchesella cincta TaxID=48709 RepID=A0A1D2MWK7_ORCCI|nr:hypothetical protein Ocin01_09346 [Orchesella cincta]